MKNFLKTFLLISAFLFILPFVWRIEAASLKFDKTTASVANGGTFQISVTVDPAGEGINSTDVYVSYDAAVLRPTAVSAGSLFPYVSNDIATSGKVYIAGMVADPASSVSASGTVAVITFQALKDATTTLSFDCSTSKVIKNDTNATNILNCSQNNSCTVTVGAGGGNNPTATPGSGGNLPNSGILENVIKFAVPGAILLILGGALRFVL
ncbi:MAG: cohesin domain-containing protein [Candidatus Roizmanbacteria bacterium]